jgi:hypothetical protein
MKTLWALAVLHALAALAGGGRAAAAADTWAVIVSSSRFWLNYRHTSNALAVYQAVKRCDAPQPPAARSPAITWRRFLFFFFFRGARARFHSTGSLRAGWACPTTASC